MPVNFQVYHMISISMKFQLSNDYEGRAFDIESKRCGG